MVWPIRSRSRICGVVSEMATHRPSLIYGDYNHCSSSFSGLCNFFSGFFRKRPPSNSIKKRIGESHLGAYPELKFKASTNSMGLTQELANIRKENLGKVNDDPGLFAEMKQRFLIFKKHKFLKNPEHFRALAEAQAPKNWWKNLQFQEQFMVIACADSRVCPSNVLGFQPGEAFVIRNVANIVTPHENGLTETNAALEFAVDTLRVENILVIGHSSCGGIEALMSAENEVNSSSLLHNWVANARVAKLRTKAAASHLSFDQQCRHCEKVSINRSLMNLLTYPWIKDRVKKDLLSVHGGYYNFSTCSFEKWTLDNKASISNTQRDIYLVKDHSFWC